jgi:methylated-DNA-[protein]-cysteine S-methyltransferase
MMGEGHEERDARHAPVTAGATGGWSACLRAPFGMLGLRTDGGALTEVAYLSHAEPEQSPTDAVAQRAAVEIARYLDDPQWRFTVPLAPRGTAFQRRVWDAILAIPVSESRTYGELARTLHSAARAIGQACGANPIALVIPCHRVVGSGGAIGGFMNMSVAAGDPLAIKRWLLVHEGYRFGR